MKPATSAASASRVRRTRSAPDSRERIMAAASAEFAARGFDGARVDRIAERARFNKAMIYYHFRSKQALYRALLKSMLAGLAARIQPIAASDSTPFEKLDAFVRTLVESGLDRPDLPPIIMREIAEGGRHVDANTLQPMLDVLAVMTSIVADGTSRGAFTKVNPLLLHLTTLWPIMVYLISTPMRTKMESVGRFDTSSLSPESFIRHMQNINRRAVAQEHAPHRTRSRHAAPESAS
jgi:AcrR family transcriptional regulator